MSGPAKIPTCLKDPAVSKQAGNPNEPTPAVLGGCPEPPEGWPDATAEIWRRVARVLWDTSPSLLTAQDLPVFAMLVQSLELYARAQVEIDKDGIIKTSNFKTGKKSANPCLAIRAASMDEVVRLSALFGLTPSHRATMTAGVQAGVSGGQRPGPEAEKRIR